MSEPFLAEIRIVGFNFAPRGWAFCDGQILPINQNQALFSLLGTTYGGDGRTSFGLPELRGRTPLHPGDGITLGAKSGEETHTLSTAEIPQHSHAMQGSGDAATTNTPGNSQVFARATQSTYHTPGANVGAVAGTVSNTGGGQAHNNMQPSLAVNFCIALQGLFPSRN